MRDNDDRLIFLFQISEHFKEFRNLRRCQHRGRLVQKKDRRIIVKCFKDFDPLPLSHREIFNRFFGIKLKMIAVDQIFYLFLRPLPIKEESFFRLMANNNIFCNSQIFHLNKMLVHHRKPTGNRIVRRMNFGRFVIDSDFPLVRTV